MNSATRYSAAASSLNLAASDHHVTGGGETCRSVPHRRENRPNLTTLPRTQGCDSSGAPAVCLHACKSGRPPAPWAGTQTLRRQGGFGGLLILNIRVRRISGSITVSAGIKHPQFCRLCRSAPSALARSYPGLLTKNDPPKRPFGARQVRGLDAKESPATGSRVGCKGLARLRRG